MKFKELESSTQIILKVVLVGLLLAFLWVVRDIILIFLLALILASAMEPMVDYFNKKRVPRAVSVLTVYILVIGFAVLIIYLLIPPVLEQIKFFQARLPDYGQALQARFSGSLLGGIDIMDSIKNFVSGVSGGSVLSQTYGVFSGLFSIITVLVISFYLVAEQKGMKAFIATIVPEQHQEFTLMIIEKVQKKMGLWIIGQIFLSCCIFVLSFSGLIILRVPNALLLALLAGLLEVVPYIGPFLSAVPAVLIALIYNPPLALAVAVLYLLIQKTEGYVLVPKIMQRTVGTSPLAVLIALLVGFKLAGFIGLLIAVPLVGAITVIVNEFWANKNISIPATIE